ncbi:MAG: glycerol-3-phosphate 1-O-acyltransferase [Gammaproteobacteria bacterium]|nr:MAG: glycerol-3-phosphate 1-O-acyltransferase [Gammaproteobacteria bacterium]
MKGLGVKWLIYWLVRRVLYVFVKTSVRPEKLDTLNIDPEKPILYVLKNKSLSDLLVLDEACKAKGLPQPTDGIHFGDFEDKNGSFFLTEPVGTFNRKPMVRSLPEKLVKAVDAIEAQAEGDIQLVPVSIFWGRVPDRENSILKILLSDSWAVPGLFRKLLIIMVQGRNTMIHFYEPISIRQTLDDATSSERTVRKLSRVLRVHFRRARETVIGPDLSHRRTIVNAVLRKPGVVKAITQKAQESDKAKRKVAREARKYAEEIAADYSHPVIRVYDIVLTWLWNKLYDGVSVTGFERLEKVAKDNVVIYVPCHRSHIDYLLMSYVLFSNKLVPPHIAAGVNLNLPVLGKILRHGGAFFLRRSFKGNRLYTSVFNEYVNEVFDRGFSVEYFIEGGRSRTGRLMQPRPGMISMTVRSFLRTRRRNFVFVPIYFGYEKVLEGGTYVGELSGKTKKKESVLDIFRTLKKIRGTFGQVYVNFGEPIHLNDHLDNSHPGWRDETYDEDHQPDWLADAVNELGLDIITRINNAAVVNPVSLLSQVMLATNKHAMDETLLEQQLNLYLSLLKNIPYADTTVLPDLSGREIIAYGERLEVIERRQHSLGDVFVVNADKAVLLTYFRNNNLHMFALTSFLARLLINNRGMTKEALLLMCRQVYPFLRSELFMNLSLKELPAHIEKILQQLVDNGLIVQTENEYWSPKPSSKEYLSLTILANAIRQTLERYFITVDLLTRAGSGVLSRNHLENLCHLMAQRMSLLYEFSAPEFFDKALFKNFLQSLIKNGAVWMDEEGKLAFDKRLETSEQETHLILSVEIREAIQQVSQLDVSLLEDPPEDSKKKDTRKKESKNNEADKKDAKKSAKS